MAEDSTRTGTDAGRLSVHDAGLALSSLLTSEEDKGEDEGADAGEERGEGEADARLRRALKREDPGQHGDDESEEEEPEESEEDAEEETEEDEALQSDEDEARKRSPQDPEFTVHVDGKDVQVRLSEMRNGYLRQSDYTRKTQTLATERKSFEQEIQTTRAERAEYAELLPKLRQAVQLETEQEPNWAELQVKDPAKFPIEWARWQQRSKQLQQIRDEEARVGQRVQAEQARMRDAFAKDQREKLLASEPVFKNPKTAKARAADIEKLMREVGFADNELAVFDHRAMRLLNKAVMFDQLMAQQPKLRKQMRAAPVVRPDGGSRKSNSPTREASARLSQSGRVSDAAKLFESFL